MGEVEGWDIHTCTHGVSSVILLCMYIYVFFETLLQYMYIPRLMRNVCFVCRYSTAVGQAVRDCLDLWCRMDADVSLSYSIVGVKSRNMALKGFAIDVYNYVYF